MMFDVRAVTRPCERSVREATGQLVHVLCYVATRKTELAPWPRRTNTYGSVGAEEATVFCEFPSVFTAQEKRTHPRGCTYSISGRHCVAAAVVWLAPLAHL